MKNVVFAWIAFFTLIIGSAAYAQSVVMPNSYKNPKVQIMTNKGWLDLETKTSWTGGRNINNPVVVSLPEWAEDNSIIRVYLTINNKEFHIMVLNGAFWSKTEYVAFKPLRTAHVGPLSVSHHSLKFKMGDACPVKGCNFKKGQTTLFYLYEKLDTLGTPYLPDSQIGAHFKFVK